MRAIAGLSMRNRALVALVTICAALFGVLAVTQLREELTPSVQLPQLVVMTDDSGASPQVISTQISTPIESAIEGVEGLSSSSAVSSSGQSLVTAKFAYGTNLDTAEEKVDAAIDQVRPTLPSAVTPQVISASLSSLPVIELGVSGSAPTEQLGANINRLDIPALERVAGVADAELVGIPGERVTITPNAKRLATDHLTVQEVDNALKASGSPLAGGQMTTSSQSLDVQAGAALASLAEIRSIPVVGAETTRSPKTIGDIASVVENTDPQSTLSQINGKPGLTIAVTALPNANTVSVSNAVKRLVPQLQARVGGGIRFTTVFDQGPFITQSISSLSEEGVLGLGFAVIVILLFLASARSTLVTAISIPTSVLITLIAMWAGGYTLNILTLGGLTIAIGRVVDDSIVVIENIKRHLIPGAERAASVVEAVGEVAGAITASTITTVAVFLPIAFLTGATGQLFRPFAVTVAIALLASLIVALTIVPVLAYWLLRPRHGGLTGDVARTFGRAVWTAGRSVTMAGLTLWLVFAAAFPRLLGESARIARARPAAAERPVARLRTAGPGATRPTERVRDGDQQGRLQRGYRPIIRWTLGHSGVTIAIAAVVLAGTASLAPLLTTNFLGDTGQNTLTITQQLSAGASLATKTTAAEAVDTALLHTKGVTAVQAMIGGTGSTVGDALAGGGGNSTFNVTTDPTANQLSLQNTITAKLDKVAGAGQTTVSSAGQSLEGTSSVEIDLTASSDTALQTASNALVHKLKSYSTLSQVSSNLAASLPYLAVNPNLHDAARYGLTGAQINSLVAQATDPTQVGTIELGSSNLKIYVATPSAPTTIAALKRFAVATPFGSVPLDKLASVTQSTTPASISTQNGLHSAEVTAMPTGQELTQANRDVSAALREVKLPAGTQASVGGELADQSSSFSQLGLALLVAILIVYVVMVATFKSLRQPLLLLVSVPFAATGAIVLQVISAIPLGVASLIGVLMLVGIVVTNAIVLVDLVNQYRRRGMSVHDAVIAGAGRRLRPILMTALATILALTPMALGVTGHGSFISQPLAIVVIGGLLSSTLLTLIVLPTLYNLVEGFNERRSDAVHPRRPIAIPPLVLTAPQRALAWRAASQLRARKVARLPSRGLSFTAQLRSVRNRIVQTWHS